jgi:hypothetical protein
LLVVGQLDAVALFRTAHERVIERYPALAGRRLVHEIVRRMVGTLVSDLIETSTSRIAAADPVDIDDTFRVRVSRKVHPKTSTVEVDGVAFVVETFLRNGLGIARTMFGDGVDEALRRVAAGGGWKLKLRFAPQRKSVCGRTAGGGRLREVLHPPAQERHRSVQHAGHGRLIDTRLPRYDEEAGVGQLLDDIPSRDSMTMNWTPSCSPMSYRVQMCGWLTLETARVSRTRYTSPMPPTPSLSMT